MKVGGRGLDNQTLYDDKLIIGTDLWFNSFI